VELFERFRRIRRCGLLARRVSLGVGFEVSEAHTRCTQSVSLCLSLSLSLPLYVCLSVSLSLCVSVSVSISVSLCFSLPPSHAQAIRLDHHCISSAPSLMPQHPKMGFLQLHVFNSFPRTLSLASALGRDTFSFPEHILHTHPPFFLRNTIEALKSSE